MSQKIGIEFTKGELDPSTGINRGVQLMAHTALGCAVGVVGTGNCGAGAVGQLAGEISGLLYSGGMTQAEIAQQTEEWQKRGVDIARLSGAFAVVVAGGDADDVSLGSQAGGIATANNALCGGLCIAGAIGAISLIGSYLAGKEIAGIIDAADAAYDEMGGGEAGAQAAMGTVMEQGGKLGLSIYGGIKLVNGIYYVGGKGFSSAKAAYTFVKTPKGISTASLENKLVLFKGDEAMRHFEDHSASIMNSLGKDAYNLKNYVDDANHILNEGTYVPELNGYVRLIGGQGSAKYGFVGLDRATGSITTFHIKTASELAKKAPSLGINK